MLQAEKLATLTAHSGAIYALAPGRVPGTLFSAGADKVVAEWDLASGNTNPFAIRTEHTVYSLLNLGQQLVIGTSVGGMHVIDLNARREIRLLKFHDRGIFHLSRHPGQTHVYAACADGSLSVWNAEDWSLVRHLPLSHHKVRRVAVNDEGTLLAAACSDGNVHIMETANYTLIKVIEAHRLSANAALFLPGGLLLTGGKDAYLRLWDGPAGFTLVREIPAHNFAIYDIVSSPAAGVIATASRDKTVKIWDSADLGHPLRLDRAGYQGHLHSVNAAIWLKQENILATCSDDRSVILWQVRKA